MFQIQKDKQSFELKILETYSKKNLKKNNKNVNSKKDLFIRKQDIYNKLIRKANKINKIIKNGKA